MPQKERGKTQKVKLWSGTLPEMQTLRQVPLNPAQELTILGMKMFLLGNLWEKTCQLKRSSENKHYSESDFVALAVACDMAENDCIKAGIPIRVVYATSRKALDQG